MAIPRVAGFPDAASLVRHLDALGWPLPCDATLLGAPESPLAAPLTVALEGVTRVVGNRFAIQPMEGWDGTLDGRPSDLTRRRWGNFGRSGAKLIWGGEAVAVVPEGRANPHQLLLNDDTAAEIAALRTLLLAAHHEAGHATHDLLIGLQLTHSGRFARPHDKARLEPVVAYRHPWLDAKLGPTPEPMTDGAVGAVVSAFGRAARLAQQAGFHFVDLKCCHGYLGHEFLGARQRPGPYGGAFENRTRFLRECIAAVRQAAPGLGLAVRLSAFDLAPYVQNPADGRGIPCTRAAYAHGFGVNPSDPAQPDLAEARRLLRELADLGVRLINISAGSPYYTPHIQRPALFPPSDGYLPPEDPLAGVARLLSAARDLKAALPHSTVVSSGWSYLQEYLPQVAQAVVRAGWCDLVGLGRMVLSYPELPQDVLRTGTLQRKRLCRTFSDCTTAPRQGLVSGCYPLDPFYKARPEARLVQRPVVKAGGGE